MKVNGRHAAGSTRNMISKPLLPANMTTELYAHPDNAVLRIDDSENLDFWLEVTISRAELIQLLKDMDSMPNIM